jgi:hypothetical protein
LSLIPSSVRPWRCHDAIIDRIELFKFFKIGSPDSDKKLGPAVMMEKIQLAHPDFYTLPNFVAIQSFVSQCFNKEKDGKSEEPIPYGTTSQ